MRNSHRRGTFRLAALGLAAAVVLGLAAPALAGEREAGVKKPVDGLMAAIDGKGKLDVKERVPLSAEPPHPLERQLIDTPLATSVRAIDGRAQRGLAIASSSTSKCSVALGGMAPLPAPRGP